MSSEPQFNPSPEQWAQLEEELTELGRNDPTVREIQDRIEVEKRRLIRAARAVRIRREGLA